MTARWPDRRIIAAGLLALTGASLLLTAWNTHGSELLYLNTAFVVLAPGWAVAARMRLPTRSLEWALTAAVGISVALLVAQVMASTGWWHPTGAFLALDAVTLVALLPLVFSRRAIGR